MKGKHSSQNLLLSITLAVLLLGGATAFVLTKRADEQDRAKVAALSRISQPASDVKSAYADIVYAGKQGKTALELLKEHAIVTTKDSKNGPYVDSIGGVKNSTDGKYWLFFVNGQQPTLSANNYVTKDTDTIEWKFQ